MRPRRSSGNAIGGTLLVMVLLFLFGLTLANMATFDLRLVNRMGERQMAFEAAEAGLSYVTALIGKDPKKGTQREVFDSRQLEASGLLEKRQDGSTWRITFDPDHDNWSLNNLASLGINPGGNGHGVPPNHALIMAEGRSKGGEIAVIESLIRLEALPYAIAATNRITSRSVTIFGAPTGDSGAEGIASGDRPMLGNTYSGAPGVGGTSLSGLGTIEGDVRTVGTASVSSGINVVGEIDEEVDREQLPDLKIEDFNTSTTPGRTIRPGGLQLIPTLTGTVYIDGDAKFPVAATFLNATVYVDGDFEAPIVAGTGTLFVNGTTHFSGASVNLSGADRLTVFSEGDIKIDGIGVFQGVFMTHGNFVATGALAVPGALVVLGAIYANNPADPNFGNVTLDTLTSIVVHVDEYTAFASYWLALGGQAKPVQVYWNQLR